MNILDSLNPTQQAAVKHNLGPLLVLAGAGSGKTRVLTYRIAYLIEELDVNPYQILALTFTNKAAREMRERVDKIVSYGAEQIWVSTFHSTCVRILRRFIESIGYSRSFTIYDTDDQKSLMKDICKYLNIDTKILKEKAILSKISSAKDELVSPEDYMRMAVTPPERKIANAYLEYQKRLKQNNALDFDDLIYKTIELFRTDADALAYYRRRFRYILVDEYQDTNTAQFMLISMLAEYRNNEGKLEHNLCVVGDDDQSIYKFRGANIRNILDFEKQYPNAVVIRLEQNYRSTKNILSAANEVIMHNYGRKGKELWTDNDEGSAVSYSNYDDDRLEASSIAGIIKSQTEENKYAYNDFAILYRTNAQSRSFEEQLIYRSIPYKVIGNVNFYQRKEIKDLLAYLRTIENGNDDIAVKRILNIPKRGIGQTTIDRVAAYAIDRNISFYNALNEVAFIPGLSRKVSEIGKFISLIEIFKRRASDEQTSLKELMDDLIEAIGYIDYINENDAESADDRIENINELISKMAVFDSESETPRSLGEFLEEIALVADIDNLDESTNVVTLMTLHSAKGLEFSNVFLVGMEEGIFPGYMSINAEDSTAEIEEERRLCYVGITRARENLYLSSARQRMLRGEFQYNAPSRFINEIPRYMLHIAAPAKEKRLSETMPKNNISFSQKPKLYNTIFEKPKPPVKDIGAALGAKPEYEIGDKVSHMKFGTGTVLNMVRGGKDYEVTVEFEVFGIKKMLAAFANLKKL